jgi:hypothetical protein
MSAQYGKVGGVDNEVYLLGHKFSNPFGSTPEIDAYQQADPAKIGVKGSPTLPGTDAEGPTFQFAGVNLGLAAHQIPLAVEQSGGVVPFSTFLRHQASNHIGAELTRGSSQFFIPQTGEVFWKANESAFCPWQRVRSLRARSRFSRLSSR